MHAPWIRAVATKHGLPRSASDGSLAAVRSEGVPLHASEITAPESVKESFGSPDCESLRSASAPPLLVMAWLLDVFTDGTDRAKRAPAPMTARRRMP
jgi:hypothetical protein